MQFGWFGTSRDRRPLCLHLHRLPVSRSLQPPSGADRCSTRCVSERYDGPWLWRGPSDDDAASCFLAAHPDATVATVAVEVCSAAFYLDNDAGVIVSACLFGDGASAALWRSADKGRQWRASNFRSLHRPEEREKIRFVNAGGRLKNQLHRAVPRVAAESVEVLFSLCSRKPDQVIAHAGGTRCDRSD